MRFTFHHWGFSPWAIYAVIGLGLAYFGYRHDRPLAVRSLFRPLLGDRVDGPIGNTIDIVAVMGTMFGVATSLGFGVTQVNAGLDSVFGIGISTTAQLILIALITLAATASVMSGLDKGIQRLSQLNIGLAAIVLGFILIAGPTLFLITATVENTGNYLGSIIPTMFTAGAYEGNEQWLGNWTLFYWAWWASWSPFVGMFIARISRGRTVREFVLGVLLVPSLISFLWFTVLGNTGIRLLEQLPLGGITSVVATLLVISFFVTSSDSGSFVIDMLTSGGDPDPAVETRVFWALTEGLVAAALLLAGGLGALQAASIATGLPFIFVLLVAMWSIAKGLRDEFRPTRGPRQPLPPAHVSDATRREREARTRELELRNQELAAREHALELRERELVVDAQGGQGARTRGPMA
jgi:choline/glycine/proline betaine transport protein